MAFFYTTGQSIKRKKFKPSTDQITEYTLISYTKDITLSSYVPKKHKSLVIDLSTHYIKLVVTKVLKKLEQYYTTKKQQQETTERLFHFSSDAKIGFDNLFQNVGHCWLGH